MKKNITISNRQRSSLVGVLILMAYSMLTYSITNNIMLGVLTDIISGVAVIGIPLLLFPLFNSDENKIMNYGYLTSRFIEGIIMIICGIFILFPSLENYRNDMYQNIHIYFFIVGALLMYILFYRTLVIPKYISIWGIIATLILLIITIIKLFGVDWAVLDILLIPIILNEVYLAVWLMIKGFRIDKIDVKNK